MNTHPGDTTNTHSSGVAAARTPGMGDHFTIYDKFVVSTSCSVQTLSIVMITGLELYRLSISCTGITYTEYKGQ